MARWSACEARARSQIVKSLLDLLAYLALEPRQVVLECVAHQAVALPSASLEPGSQKPVLSCFVQLKQLQWLGLMGLCRHIDLGITQDRHAHNQWVSVYVPSSWIIQV